MALNKVWKEQLKNAGKTGR